MDPIERLATIFGKFPGIGPRQAERFVQFLLRASHASRRELAAAIEALSGAVHRCEQCMRFFAAGAGAAKHRVCSLCADGKRDFSLLAVLASNADLVAMECSLTYRGRYFVLGGTISLASDKTTGLHIRELAVSIPQRARGGLREIIFALPANPEGDATAAKVKDELEALAKKHGITMTSLGRGLSTGSELEYADPDTIRNALLGRK